MEKLCRICLTNDKPLKTVFRDHLSEKIYVIANLEVKKKGLNTEYICSSCEKDVNKFFEFRKKMIHSDYIVTLIETDNLPDLVPINEKEQEELRFKIEHEEVDIKPEVIALDHNYSESAYDECDNSSHLEKMNEEKEDVISDENEKQSKKGNWKRKVVKPRERKPYNPGPKVLCETCNKYILKVNYQKHVRTHSDDCQVTCPICKKTFKNEDSYRGHPAMHIRERSICPYCGKIFEFRGEYNNHIRLHRLKKENKISCDVCGKSFVGNWQLRKHKLTHAGIKPYTCKYCNKGLSTRFSLKMHLRHHTNEMPYKCEFCSEAYFQRVTLKFHLQRRHDLSAKQVNEMMEKQKEAEENERRKKKYEKLAGKIIEDQEKEQDYKPIEQLEMELNATTEPIESEEVLIKESLNLCKEELNLNADEILMQVNLVQDNVVVEKNPLGDL